MKNKGVKKWVTTTVMREYDMRTEEIRNLVLELSKPVPFLFSRVVNPEQLIVVTKELANARHLLWEEVYRTYPETKGKSLTLNKDYITEN